MKAIVPRSDCPLTYALDIFGDKWSLLILRDIMFEGKSTFSEFLYSNERIASNILVNRLNALTEAGLLIRRNSKDNKTKILYALTDKSIRLFPVLVEILNWGAEYHKGEKCGEIVDEIIKNKDQVVKDFGAALRLSNERTLNKMVDRS